jgi:hypothetical protein
MVAYETDFNDDRKNLPCSFDLRFIIAVPNGCLVDMLTVAVIAVSYPDSEIIPSRLFKV